MLAKCTLEKQIYSVTLCLLYVDYDIVLHSCRLKNRTYKGKIKRNYAFASDKFSSVFWPIYIFKSF